MATRDTARSGSGITRRDFLKASAAATAVVGCGLEFAYDPQKASAYELDTTNYSVSFTTCPYCSASCGQRVVTAKTAINGHKVGDVVDIYGDFESPFNQGGLCAKGAGAVQLVNNPFRTGAWKAAELKGGAHPVNDVFLADDADAQAFKRIGNGDWTAMKLDDAMTEIAAGDGVNHDGLIAYRGSVGPLGKAIPVFSAGDTIDGVTYTGFSGYIAVKDGTKWHVSILGNKAAKTDFDAWMLDPIANAANLLGAFDELVFDTDDLTNVNRYVKRAGFSNLGSKLAAKGIQANTADIVKDGATYRAYVADGTQLYAATSSDMMDWTVPATPDLGKPGNVAEMNSPSVIRASDGSLQVWFASPNTSASTIYYAACSAAGVWDDAVVVTVDGVALGAADFYGHPQVTVSKGTYTLHYVNGSEGVLKATGKSPSALTGKTAVYDVPADSEGNVYASGRYVAFTSYVFGVTNGWAYSDVKALVADNNSMSVAFFGSSHMNNEPNYVYRKLIAAFGTSNCEHQARI